MVGYATGGLALVIAGYFWLAPSAGKLAKLPEKPQPSIVEPAPASTAAAPTQPTSTTVFDEHYRADVERAQRWPLPLENQLPGVTSSRLGDNIDAWILSLPLDKQEQARRFAMQYAPAYDFNSKAVQAWMLAHGFPALEELAAFDYDQMTKACAPRSCQNGKIASLAANHLIDRLAELLPPGSMPDDGVLGGVLNALPEPQMRELLTTIGSAEGYIAQARDHGSVLFAAYLTARQAQILNRDSEQAAARSVIGACGDRRLRDAATLANAPQIIGMIPGARQACGYRPGMPPFPSGR